MKIIMISNYLTHHLSYICEELIKNGASVLFIACEDTPEYRLKTGFSEMKDRSYVVRYFEESCDKEKLKRKIIDADAVIIGSGDNSLIKERIKLNLLTFRFSEHLSKSKNYIINILRLLKWRSLLKQENKCSNLYLLCSSFWAKKDYQKIGVTSQKMLKWGYFPSVESSTTSITSNKKKFVWAGRFISWKHPEYIKLVYDYCDKNKIKATYDIYGDGKLKNKVMKMCLNTKINYHEPVKRENLGTIFSKNTIFLFTSDQGEGWGAILNEAMSFGCICICNSKAGSTNFLIKNGKNGFSYSSRKEFYKCLQKAMSLSQKEMDNMSDEAIKTINDLWSPKIAAKNLLKQISNVNQNGALDNSIEGPAAFFKQ